MIARRIVSHAAAMAIAIALSAPFAKAQWVTTYATFYLQAPHNWAFRDTYQHADRRFNAFDYGHAILYETLRTRPDAPASVLEERIYDRLTKQILVEPPHVPLDENAIEPMYAQLAPEAKAMLDWSHILHRQIYDVLADERLSDAAKDRAVQRLITYYKTRRDLAFSSQPKSMELMQAQPYSLAFRQKFPKFNGLIRGYHWCQVGLYEPRLVGRSSVERQAGVRATVARCWQMLQNPPRTLPYQMPMTTATMGAVMHHDRESGKMTGVLVGQMLNMSHDGMAGMDHTAPAGAQQTVAAAGHEGHGMPAPTAPVAPQVPVDALRLMLQDPVIRRRVLADSALRRMLMQSLDSLPAADRAQLQRLLAPPRSRRK